MAVSLLQRSDSIENLPELPPQHIPSQSMRESAAKAGAAVTATGCGLSKIGASAGLAMGGQHAVAPVVVASLGAAEALVSEGSKAITMSGYVDGGLEKTHAMTNSCVIL